MNVQWQVSEPLTWNESELPLHPSSTATPSVLLMQDGARGHYGLAIALQRAGLLSEMITDLYVKPGSIMDLLLGPAQLVLPDAAQRLRGKFNSELDSSRVRSSLKLATRLRLGRYIGRNQAQYFAWSSAILGKWAVGRGFGKANTLMGFVRNLDPNLCRRAQDLGLITVADQMIAPAPAEIAEMQLQKSRFPDWQRATAVPDLLAAREYEQQTWDKLHHVTCPSDYVREQLIAQGLPPEKVTTIHYPVDEHAFRPVSRKGRGESGSLIVGFVGAIGLRKGAPYFLRVAERFKAKGVRFVMIGPIELNRNVLTEYQGEVEILGPVPRSKINEWYSRFDLFFLPTTCEGSASALMEAMASKMPVVTSPNSGTVARHGVEGFISRYDEIDAFASHIETLLRDEELRLSMGEAARRRYEEFNINSYSASYARLFRQLINPATYDGRVDAGHSR